MKSSLLRSCVAASTLMLSLALCIAASDAQAAEPTRGGSVVFALGRMPSVLVPAIEPSAGVGLVGGKMMESLFNVDRDGNVSPRLALSISASADQKTFTIKLRPGVKWHDGQDFSSADVAFTVMEVWKTFLSNTAFTSITAVDTPDPNTVVLHTLQPLATSYLSYVLTQGPAVVLPRHLYEGKDLRTNPVNQRPIGTGPYKFAQRDQSQYVTMERNPNYWNPKLPYLDKITVRVIPDVGAVAAAVESGEVQIAPASTASTADARRLASSDSLAVTTTGFEGLQYFGTLIFNLKSPALQDVRVRQAVAYAVDRALIAKSAFGGFAKPATSIFPIGSRYYDAGPDLPGYPFDPGKARALLNASGATADGKRLKLRLAVAPFSEGLSASGEYLQQALSDVGIDVEMTQNDIAGALRRIYRDYDFDLAVSIVTAGADPAISTPNYFWSKTIDKIAFHNASQYRNSDVDSIIDKLSIAEAPADRQRLARDLQRIVMRDLPVLPLVEQSQYTIYRRQVQNVANDPIWAYSDWGDLWLKK